MSYKRDVVLALLDSMPVYEEGDLESYIAKVIEWKQEQLRKIRDEENIISGVSH